MLLRFIVKGNSGVSVAGTLLSSRDPLVIVNVTDSGSTSPSSKSSAIPDITILGQGSLRKKFHSQTVAVPKVHSETQILTDAVPYQSM